MSDEDFVTGEGRIQLPNSDDVEEMLEILMKIAKSEGREFWHICWAWLSWKPATSLLRRDISRISGTNLDFSRLEQPSRMARRIAGDALSKGVEHPTMRRFS